MAEEAKKPEAAPAAEAEKVKKKKLRPTNCAQTNKRIRRKDWYYRDGKYFSNKQAYVLYVTATAEKKAKEQQAKQAAEAAPAAAEAPKAAE